VKNVATTVAASAASVPPSQTGLVTQYRKLLTAPMRWPNAIRGQMYGPPSSGKVDPSSATMSADGRKKRTASTMSQVNAWPPFAAIAPTVSTPTRVQMRKNVMSERPKCRWSLARSTSAAAVVLAEGTATVWVLIAAL
jgi:hypothetical protein